ncbi:MAG: hypothetical protein ACTTIC_08015 [Helicobacteraceae bacterium]
MILPDVSLKIKLLSFPLMTMLIFAVLITSHLFSTSNLQTSIDTMTTSFKLKSEFLELRIWVYKRLGTPTQRAQYIAKVVDKMKPQTQELMRHSTSQDVRNTAATLLEIYPKYTEGIAIIMAMIEKIQSPSIPTQPSARNARQTQKWRWIFKTRSIKSRILQ